MELVFWAATGVVAYTYFGYIAVIYALALFFNRRIRTGEALPRVTFLITAFNEEKNIGEKLENTLSLDYPKDKLEIIVASDGSTDSTDELVRKEFGPRGVRLIRVEGRVGKTETQNRAVLEAGGDVVIFSDATTKYENSAIKSIVKNYSDPEVGAVSGRYKYLDPGSTLIGTGTVAFWDLENAIKSRQNRIKTISGCCGCIYSVRRSLYEPLPADIISDLTEPLKILEKGYRIVFEPGALAYETACEKSSEEFRMRVRVITRGMRGILYMRKLLNPFKYGFVSFQLVSHKVLRWLVPFFLAAVFVSSAALAPGSRFYLAAFVMQSLFYIFALAGWLMNRAGKDTVKIFSLPLYFCVVNAASAVALFRVMMHRKDVVWKTVR